MNTFTIGEVFSTGWRITKEKFWFLLGAGLILFVVGNIPNMLGRNLDGAQEGIVGIIQFVVNIFLELGMIRIAINLVDGKEVSYNNFWSEKEKFFPLLGASILFGLMVGLGIVLLIVPGIILALTYGLYSYLIVDKNEGVIESLKMSAALTKGHRWHLFGFLVLVALLNVLGAIVFGIGLIVTVPVTTIATAAVYRKLSGSLTPVPVSVTPTPATTTA